MTATQQAGGPGASSSRELAMRALQERLATLPEDYAALIDLRFARGLPLPQAALVLGASAEEARLLQWRALRALRDTAEPLLPSAESEPGRLA